jgi:hypothetical protein
MLEYLGYDGSYHSRIQATATTESAAVPWRQQNRLG